jgi:hypothetical protein
VSFLVSRLVLDEYRQGRQAFVPYTNLLSSPAIPATDSDGSSLATTPLQSAPTTPTGLARAKSLFVHANVTKITDDHVEIDRRLTEIEGLSERLERLSTGSGATALLGDRDEKRQTKIPYDYLLYASVTSLCKCHSGGTYYGAALLDRPWAPTCLAHSTQSHVTSQRAFLFFVYVVPV